MAKNTCAICGAEVNLMTGQKLADGNYICRKVCRKKGLKYFDYMHASLPAVQAHIAQVEFGTKAWYQIFEPRMKTKDKAEKLKRYGFELYISESTGLMALNETHYKILFFGKSVLACAYRIADLYDYQYEEETKKVNDKDETTRYAHLYFRNVSGLSNFRIKMEKGEFPYLEKYFNELFGIQKTLGNAANTWKSQIDAMKAVGTAVGAMKDGGEDLESKNADAIDALNTAQYGDRTELIARADAALASVQG